MDFFVELFQFLKTRKKFWLIPFLLIVIVISVVIVISTASALGPFIYSLF